LCCPRDVHAVDFILGKSVRDAAGHDEMKNGDERSCPISGRERVSFDRGLIDGAPAARFTARLKDLIECGYGLDDSTEEPELAVAQGTSRKSHAAL
jgi:hypothetical protein